jgi:hypothetical protein
MDNLLLSANSGQLVRRIDRCSGVETYSALIDSHISEAPKLLTIAREIKPVIGIANFDRIFRSVAEVAL